jgi:hypothetical protein
MSQNQTTARPLSFARKLSRMVARKGKTELLPGICTEEGFLVPTSTVVVGGPLIFGDASAGQPSDWGFSSAARCGIFSHAAIAIALRGQLGQN